MRKPDSMKGLEKLGRVRLSKHFFMRDMLYSEHDHLPYSHMEFFQTYAAFNLGWHEMPERRIDSWITPRGRGGRILLTKPGMANHSGDHSTEYPGFPEPRLS